MTEHSVEANSPEWHEQEIRSIIAILRQLKLSPPTALNKRLANMAYRLAKGHLGAMQLEIQKLREVIITADGFHDFKTKDGREYKGILLKVSARSLQSDHLVSTPPIQLGEYDQASIKLFSPYCPEEEWFWKT